MNMSERHYIETESIVIFSSATDLPFKQITLKIDLKMSHLDPHRLSEDIFQCLSTKNDNSWHTLQVNSPPSTLKDDLN